MAEITIEAIRRKVGTKGSVNQLRRDGYVPGIFYKHTEENIPLAIKYIKLKPVIFSAETYLINLKLPELPEQKCVLKEFQLDPVTNEIVHFDLMGLREGEKIVVDVAVHIVGTAIGVRDGGIVQHSLHKLQLECLPTEIPDKIDIDVTKLKIGDSIHVRDLKMENFRFLSSQDATIVAIVPPTVHKEVTPTAVEAEPTAAEPEVISKGKKTEEE